MHVSKIGFVAFLATCAFATQTFGSESSQLVQLNSAGTPPTPLQLKRAEVQEKSLTPEPGDLLTGVLRKPEGSGPFAAVVLLHGCEGPKEFQNDWAKLLTGNGYVSLMLDSFTPRGQTGPVCDRITDLKRNVLGAGRVFDAYGALDYLGELPFVDSGRIAVMAWTREAGISLVNNDSSSRFFDQRFAASIQFYPECLSTNAGGDFFAPLLILYPAENDWALLKDCKSLGENSTGVKPEIRVYPGAYFGFDDPEFGAKQTMETWENLYKSPARGVTAAYDQMLTKHVSTEVLNFLSDVIQD